MSKESQETKLWLSYTNGFVANSYMIIVEIYNI